MESKFESKVLIVAEQEIKSLKNTFNEGHENTRLLQAIQIMLHWHQESKQIMKIR